MLERWLGGENSWRRVVSLGIAGGLALAILAALVASLFGGGSGSLDGEQPTAAVPFLEPDVPLATEPPIEAFTPAPTVEVVPDPSLETTATEVVVDATPTVEPTLPAAPATDPVETPTFEGES